jgi:hypothetical protein
MHGGYVLHSDRTFAEFFAEELNGSGDLHAFHGKLEQKAAWTRGLFISHSGFTKDGLHAFGHGERVVCMVGLDLYDALEPARSGHFPLTTFGDYDMGYDIGATSCPTPKATLGSAMTSTRPS